MRRRLIVFAVFLLLAWSCSNEGSFWVTVRFPDQASKNVAKELTVYAIEPGEGADCQALMDETAKPYDSGYSVEDRVDIQMPATEGGRPLKGIGPGLRLFFAQAIDQQDNVFLRGCTLEKAGGKGVQTVIIVLEKTCACPPVPHADGECVDSICWYQCHPGWFNADEDWSNGCECQTTRQGVEWCDNLDNDCDGQTDEDCTQCQDDTDCVDADSCLEGTCTDGTCSTETSADGTACDDGVYCTTGDQCEAGACVGTARDCSTGGDTCNDAACDEEARACVKQPHADGSGCDDGFYCTTGETCLSGTCQGGQPPDCSHLAEECVEGVCNENTDQCEGRPMQDGEDCDDGIDCTTPDECDGAGNCVGVLDDNRCPAGEYCRPDCASSPTGCMQPPVLQVDCPDTPVPVGQSATCTITADGMTGQEDCLQCVPHLLNLDMPLVDFSQGGQPNVCDLEGWRLESGNLCQAPGAFPTCPLDSTKGSGPSPCCPDLVCPLQAGSLAGEIAMEADRAHCSDKEWRLYRLFDFRGYDQGQVCYDFGSVDAESFDIFQLQADPLDRSQRIVIRCRDGGGLPSEDMMIDCRNLPTDVFGWAQTRLTFWMRSDRTGNAWILDNLWVTAQYQNCQTTTVVAFEEDFEGCPVTIPDGWNNWSVQGNPRCFDTNCAGDGLEAEPPESWVIEHDVDTSALTEVVHLCWTLGDESGSAAQFIVEFNTGTGWQEAYRDDDALVYRTACRKVCRDLTAIDPATAANPSLRIRFDLTTSDNAVILDDIVVSGPERCDATGLLQSGAVTPSGSDYGVDVSNLDDTPYQVLLECSWDGAGPAYTASDTFRFMLP